MGYHLQTAGQSQPLVFECYTPDSSVGKQARKRTKRHPHWKENQTKFTVNRKYEEFTTMLS